MEICRSDSNLVELVIFFLILHIPVKWFYTMQRVGFISGTLGPHGFRSPQRLWKLSLSIRRGRGFV